VGEQERPRLAFDAVEKGLQARGGARIDDQAVQLVGADHAVASQVHQIDQIRHLVELPPARS